MPISLLFPTSNDWEEPFTPNAFGIATGTYNKYASCIHSDPPVTANPATSNHPVYSDSDPPRLNQQIPISSPHIKLRRPPPPSHSKLYPAFIVSSLAYRTMNPTPTNETPPSFRRSTSKTQALRVISKFRCRRKINLRTFFPQTSSLFSILYSLLHLRTPLNLVILTLPTSPPSPSAGDRLDGRFVPHRTKLIQSKALTFADKRDIIRSRNSLCDSFHHRRLAVRVPIQTDTDPSSAYAPTNGVDHWGRIHDACATTLGI
ncbi:hypothetical protein R3P38DRAFT_3355906 [Favolaschia claudopus]|uniref:Uncharacterized protein n=1 Tax=Favolaschia claudopus TaxID=2862362 RepID=A0AAW0BKC8_9AGAR